MRIRRRAWNIRRLAGWLAAAAWFTALWSCAAPRQAEPFSVVETSIAEIQQAIRTERTNCVEVVRAYIERVQRYDRPTGLNAITVVNPAALTRAAELDRALADGRAMGPLFCAPVLVKDNFDTHDMPTTGGSIVLANHYPPDDAFMVRKIREADAVIVAKTNMAEFAFSPRQTESSSYGITANAYALDRVPAGSSGGTASGVAASFGVAGLGTDTGNSIRGPSSHLALFGIRSTIGLTSRDGVIPLAFDRDIAGPMARSVEDAARIFNVVAGYDPADPFTEDGKREADYTVFLDPEGLRGARIGVLRALVDTGDADPQVVALFERALEDLRQSGAVIVDPIKIARFAEHLEDKGFCERFRYDMYVYLQSLGMAAPVHDVMEIYESGRYSPYVKDAFARFGNGPLDVPPERWDPPCLPYLENPWRKAFHDDVTAAMDQAGVDVLIYPTWTNPPAHLDKAREEYKGDNSQLVAPATGMPAATVPMGYTYGNLPAGLQILARRYGEGAIFRIAYAYEQATRHRRPPERFIP
jgi:Asp-tRNA(Asn)/Glu-tRNA(Gln) amidotransferase A subunit family amidase